MKQPLKIGICLSCLLVEVQKSVFRGCSHTIHFHNVLPHALLFQKCLLFSLILQIESNHSRGIDANGSLNGGIGLRRNDEADLVMTTHERQFIQYIFPERLLNALISVIVSSRNKSTPRCVLLQLYSMMSRITLSSHSR